MREHAQRIRFSAGEGDVYFASDSGARMRSGAQYRQDVFPERKESKKTPSERKPLNSFAQRTDRFRGDENNSTPTMTRSSGVPNSAMAAMYGYTGEAHAGLDEIMHSRMGRVHQYMDNQIPAAEGEADEIASSVTSGRTPDSIKSALGEQMGADFSDVRFHTDAAATQKAADIGARAYTVGRDVYFGEGGFAPDVAAHELVHTAQQGAVESEAPTVSAPMGGVQMLPGFMKSIGRGVAKGARAVGRAISAPFRALGRRLFGNASGTAGAAGGQAAGPTMANVDAYMAANPYPDAPIYDTEYDAGAAGGQAAGPTMANYEEFMAANPYPDAPVYDPDEDPSGLGVGRLRQAFTGGGDQPRTEARRASIGAGQNGAPGVSTLRRRFQNPRR